MCFSVNQIDYLQSVNHQSDLQRNTFPKSPYIFFFGTSECAANYAISSEVYDGNMVIRQKILKL